MIRSVMHECGVATMSLSAIFHFCVESRLDLFNESVEQIMREVRQLRCDARDFDDMRLALIEAMANAILHGNRRDPSKRVQVCGGCLPSGDLVLTVTDEGDGFDYSRIHDPKAGDNVFLTHGLTMSGILTGIEKSMKWFP